ncbi:MAG TPA: hypothetical protein VGK30_14825 [Candidatus Binatia bacterium]
MRSRAWDCVWMLSALWLVPLVLWLARGAADPESGAVNSLYLGLTALFWIGHRLCSAWLAYGTEAYRPVLREQPIRFLLLPALVTAACFALFLPSDSALPWTREQRLIALAIVDYIFVTYHFAAQHFGALSLYRIRSERGGTGWTRRLDWLFAAGIGGVLVLVADVLAGAVAYQDVWVDGFAPDWLVTAAETIRVDALAIVLVATAVMLVAEALPARRSLPRALYVLGIAAMVAVGLQPKSLFLFIVIWTSQHWLVAVALASRVPRWEPAPAHGSARRALHAMNRRPWAVLTFFMTASVLLLPFFEVEANRQGGTYYGDRIFGAAAAALRTSSWVPALVALGFATGFLHYLLDRSVFRLSDPTVRTAARGLVAHPTPAHDRRSARRAA